MAEPRERMTRKEREREMEREEEEGGTTVQRTYGSYVERWAAAAAAATTTS